MDKDKTPPDSTPAEKSKSSDPGTPKEIPLVSVPNDQEMIADEMAELFEEDQVTHKHGNTEPEGD